MAMPIGAQAMPLHAEAKTDKAKHEAEIQAVAKQFESVLVSQLLDVLWKTTSAGGEKASQYQQMYQEAFAEHIVSGGGVGLSSMISRSLGGVDKAEGMPERALSALASLRSNASAQSAAVMGARSAEVAPTPAIATTGVSSSKLEDGRPAVPAVGVMADLQRAAAAMLDGGGKRWARSGTLTAADLSSDFTTQAAAGGQARFSVRDANGYQGYYKCNLFAFEMARRAGLQVPLVAREAGWGFPSSNRVTQDASDGSLDAGWASVATGVSPAAMQDALGAGEAAFLLVGSGQGERHGHMAVVERPKSIEYDSEGQIQRIVFDGWEAQPGGARHLQKRAWNRQGHPGGSADRNGLTRIEIIQLNRSSSGSPAEQPMSDTAKSSQLDSVSSNGPNRPTQGEKEHS